MNKSTAASAFRRKGKEAAAAGDVISAIGTAGAEESALEIPVLLTQVYDGTEPAALSKRKNAAGTVVENYHYDLDGEMDSASPGRNGANWTLGWDGEGRLKTVSTNLQLSPGLPESSATDLTFAYGPAGGRIRKTIHGTRLINGVATNVTYSDLFIDDLELRSTEQGKFGYYNIDLGNAHAQIAPTRARCSTARTGNRCSPRQPPGTFTADTLERSSTRPG